MYYVELEIIKLPYIDIDELLYLHPLFSHSEFILYGMSYQLGAIQIIPDTFLALFRTPPCDMF
jgi:hypothetical protein